MYKDFVFFLKKISLKYFQVYIFIGIDNGKFIFIHKSAPIKVIKWKELAFDISLIYLYNFLLIFKKYD